MTGTSRSIDSSESAETSQIPSLSTPTIVHTAITENTSLQITSHKLNGKNFLPWSRSVQMVIRGRGKLGYLLGQKQRPDENDPAFQIWDAENSIVMAWLVNSMEPNIGQTYLFYQTAAELWEAVKETYSDLENSSQLFELRNMARNLKQGDMDVTHYFNSLKNLWQELDLFNECEWRCIDDGARYKKLVDKDRIYDFLAGLNKELDDVRGRILGTKPLPSIREIFAEVRREESRKRVMLGEPKSLIHLKCLLWLFRDLIIPTKVASCGVIIATNRITPKSVVGGYMVNQQIGKTIEAISEVQKDFNLQLTLIKVF